MKEVILTGIKPTGTPHIGNYFGMIRPALEFCKGDDRDFYYFIADYHALTSVKNSDEFKDYSYEVAATWLACGLDPDKVVFYRQSDISEIFELSWILSCVTTKGLMNRAHAYKAAVEQNIQSGNPDEDAGINMGLFNYPILMAADILLFNTNRVPVGLDQKQHVEIARDIAKWFNKKYGYSLVSPKEEIKKEVETIVGLDGRKMSKSYGNTIPLFASEQELHKKIKGITTDSTPPNEPKSTDSYIFQIFKLFANEEELVEVEKSFKEGISWFEAKEKLFEIANKFLTPMREKYNYYMSNKHLIDEILEKGKDKAKVIAKETIERVRKAIGKNV